MTSRNKKILWSIAGATVVTLALLYFFFPPVHNWVNSVIGRNEKTIPKPGNNNGNEFEYGTPVESFEAEKLDIQRDSLLDSLINADTTLMAGVVRPIDGPQPTHVEGFGEGPLPPAPSEENMPIKNPDEQDAEGEGENAEQQLIEIEQHVSQNPAINKKIVECREAYNKLHDVYRQFVANPTPKLKSEGNKQKDAVLKLLTQLMKLAQTNGNDEAGLEEAADLRREVNKMLFQDIKKDQQPQSPSH